MRVANKTFIDMVTAKRPDVIISCFGRNTSKNELVKYFGSGGIDGPSGHVTMGGVPMRRVNAFHPSYAVNYYPTYSCFRRLLLLEFCHAFGVWCGDWQEQAWMDVLREICRDKAQALRRAELAGVSKPERDEREWPELLDSIDKVFEETDFLQDFSDFKTARSTLLGTDMNWLCCDAGLFLQQMSPSDPRALPLLRTTAITFQNWAQKMWAFEGPPLKQNDPLEPGMFPPTRLAGSPFVAARFGLLELQNAVLRFLRDMNFSYVRPNPTSRLDTDCQAQGFAFLRLAKALEKILERIDED
ncbi:hypothetical protein H2200_004185 [Cladophialophora chaetospira]|uniref:Uncharacterized protein n=1 Tax=Cladophialophora chaetospira TaxID=386627 RepID=A0AA39CLV1_9EURO|nr:hypothetical protein H2200_004185 [Cladophialophora chaetospira]